jgi:hypothetical protein
LIARAAIITHLAWFLQRKPDRYLQFTDMKPSIFLLARQILFSWHIAGQMASLGSA